MTIFIDSEYKAYTVNDGSRRAVESSYFDGKAPAFIEGYRYIPPGESWTSPDGVVCIGEMRVPWKPYAELYQAQLEYELSAVKAQLQDTTNALAIMGVTVDG